MKIVICASIEFTPQIKDAADILKGEGHDVEIPITSRRILEGELGLEEFMLEKETKGDSGFRQSAMRKIRDDVIKRYYNIISQADAILVLNLEKKGISNYIGGNTFLEMGFAYVLDKKIFLFNDVPDLPYADEILAMQPVIIKGDLSKVDC